MAGTLNTLNSRHTQLGNAQRTCRCKTAQNTMSNARAYARARRLTAGLNRSSCDSGARLCRGVVALIQYLRAMWLVGFSVADRGDLGSGARAPALAFVLDLSTT